MVVYLAIQDYVTRTAIQDCTNLQVKLSLLLILRSSHLTTQMALLYDIIQFTVMGLPGLVSLCESVSETTSYRHHTDHCLYSGRRMGSESNRHHIDIIHTIVYILALYWVLLT